MKSMAALILGLATLGVDAEAEIQTTEAEPIFARQERFRIPYRYDAAEMARLGAREIQLYVTSDRGASWHYVQSVAPDAGRFEFQAPADGEYWFAVGTLDGRNQLHPPGPSIEPGLKVIVDREPPRLELAIDSAGPGMARLTWRADDANLDESTLVLEAIQAGWTAWQPVKVVPAAAGQTAWTVPQGGLVAVRARISDRAGNIIRAQQQAHVNPAGVSGLSPQTPDLRKPMAQSHPDVAGTNGPLATQPLPAIGGARTAAPPANANPFPPSPQHEDVIDAAGGPQQTVQRKVFPSGSTASANAALRQVTEDDDRDAQQAPRAGDVSPPIRQRVVGTRKFQIGYAIDDAGAAVSGVELFVTENAGEQWWKYGDDDDRRSPVEVEVPGEGTFGFALRVHANGGATDEPPQPGDAPSMVVVVDETPPAAQLLPIERQEGPLGDQLLIRWRVTDLHPDAQPVSLSYAASPQGPWQPISDWQPDRGSYQWTLGADVPPSVFIRLAARDAAGNVGYAQTDRPTIARAVKPTARFVDVEAIQPVTR